eukprot:7342163-Heterocapsa_arctica.AAC.1
MEWGVISLIAELTVAIYLIPSLLLPLVSPQMPYSNSPDQARLPGQHLFGVEHPSDRLQGDPVRLEGYLPQ